jgi:hypothetical protein
MGQETTAPSTPIITLPMPADFTISQVNRPLLPPLNLNITVPEPDPNRIGSTTDACPIGAPQILANSLGEVSRESIRSALRQCGQPSNMDMKMELDSQTDFGVRGYNRLRVTHRF